MRCDPSEYEVSGFIRLTMLEHCWPQRISAKRNPRFNQYTSACVKSDTLACSHAIIMPTERA